VSTSDYHTAGEPFRIVPDPPVGSAILTYPSGDFIGGDLEAGRFTADDLRYAHFTSTHGTPLATSWELLHDPHDLQAGTGIHPRPRRGRLVVRVLRRPSRESSTLRSVVASPSDTRLGPMEAKQEVDLDGFGPALELEAPEGLGGCVG
jgi:hypothetical protein